MYFICFAISSNVKLEVIIEFCRQELPTSSGEIFLVEDHIEYYPSDDFDTTKTCVRYSVSSGEFDAWVQIYSKDELYSDFNEIIIFLKKLSQFSNAQLLISDDTLDVCSFILIEPSGQCSTIQVEFDSYNEKDELNFGWYENHFFGQFALKHPIDENSLKMELAELFKDSFNEFEVQIRNSGPVVNGDFDKNKLQFTSLADYCYHFDIIPKGKQKWYSIREKTEIFSKKMTDFSVRNNIDVCIFPADFSEVENIEGGSDSTQYCINCVNGQTEKIVYKIRRESWKTQTSRPLFRRLFGFLKR